MRPLLRSSLCALVLCCILFSNSFCGIALAESSTEQCYSFNSSRSVPAYVDFRLTGLLKDIETNSLITLSPLDIVDDNSSSYLSQSTVDMSNSSTKRIGFKLQDYGDTVIGSAAETRRIDLASFAFRLETDEYGSFVLSPFATPSEAYVVYKGRYNIHIYDGSVNYSRYIYDQSFELKKPISVSLSNFGQHALRDNGSYNSETLEGCTISLESEFITVSDITDIVGYNNNIKDQTDLNDNQFIDYSYDSFTYGLDSIEYYVFYDINNTNFVPFTWVSGNPTSYFSNINDVLFRLLLQRCPYNDNKVMVNYVANSNEYTEDKTLFGTISSSFSYLNSRISTNIGNVVANATDNANRIIQNTTNKINEVKEGVTEVKDSVVETKNSILDLPNKIKDMLIGLVVPDDETINAKYAEFDELLASRFGLIYQSADIIHDFAESFQTQAVMTADTGGIITMPSVTVNLVGTPFTFGGYDVDIIPDGFEFLQQALRLAISMVCTVVFVNMCKNKLEAILK